MNNLQRFLSIVNRPAKLEKYLLEKLTFMVGIKNSHEEYSIF